MEQQRCPLSFPQNRHRCSIGSRDPPLPPKRHYAPRGGAQRDLGGAGIPFCPHKKHSDSLPRESRDTSYGGVTP